MAPVYIAFDGDKDIWAYRFMKGWDANDRVNFTFEDAHDLDTMTNRAQGEAYVKKHLRARMQGSAAVIVLVGESTKNLFQFVRWEIELALEMGLPIIVSNLNNKKQMDPDRCPAILRTAAAIHIPFKLEAIKHALANWPSQFYGLSLTEKTAGPFFYDRPQWYRDMGV